MELCFVLLIVILIGVSLSQASVNQASVVPYKTSAAFPPVTQLLLCSANYNCSKLCPMPCSLLEHPGAAGQEAAGDIRAHPQQQCSTRQLPWDAGPVPGPGLLNNRLFSIAAQKQDLCISSSEACSVLARGKLEWTKAE